jgi:hypothetical protein
MRSAQAAPAARQNRQTPLAIRPGRVCCARFLRSHLASVLLVLIAGSPAFGQGARILLTPARLHRLQRDRERATSRWNNFELRVKTVPDSPERGFELALYSVVTADDQSARQAVAWALTHPCERRQVSLVLNWTRDVASEQQRRKIARASCPAAVDGEYARLRDQFFWAVAQGLDDEFKPDPIAISTVPNVSELYSLIEFVDAYRTREDQDLRSSNPQFFRRLPELFLLTSPPELLQDPSWQAHVAALALVSLDPNLESSQFLQSWAMENRFEIEDGPGVAYELLWADPYLPGLGYENLEPWLYLHAESTLWARSDWTPDACWIHIVPGHQEARNCPADWDKRPSRFGRLTLQPLDTPCFEMPPLKRDQQVMLRTARPNTKLALTQYKPPHLISSDAAGLWLFEADETAVCVAKKPER